MNIVNRLSDLITKWRNDLEFSDLDFVGEVVKIRNELHTQSRSKKSEVGK